MNVQDILKQQAAQGSTVSKARSAARSIIGRDDLNYMDVRALVAALPFVPFEQTEQVARAVYAAEVR